MSATDLYFTAPPCLLRSGAGALDVLERCLSCGIVNVGIGHRKLHGEPAFQLRKISASAEARSQGLPTECPKDVRRECSPDSPLPAALTRHDPC